jgi:hypothetical protein
VVVVIAGHWSRRTIAAAGTSHTLEKGAMKKKAKVVTVVAVGVAYELTNAPGGW